MLEGDVPALVPATSRAAILERLLRIGGSSRPTSSSASTSARATTSRRPAHGAGRRWTRWSTSRTRSRPASSGRSTGSTCRSRRRPTTRRSSQPLRRASGSSRRRSSTSGCSIPARSTRYAAARSPSRARRSTPTSASRRRAAGAGCRRRSSPELVERARRAQPSRRRPLGEPGDVFAWPAGFARIPDEDWVEQPVDAFGLHYDTVENHGWYRNLDLTVEQLAEDLRDGDVLVDYSGGTGILLDRLRLRIFDRQVGMLIVDSSPKFLRVALDRFRGDERVAFRRLHYLKDERRLEYVDEVARLAFPRRRPPRLDERDPPLRRPRRHAARRGRACCGPGGRVRINSGQPPQPARGRERVDHRRDGLRRARGRDRARPHRSALRRLPRPCSTTSERLQAYLDWRDRVFLAPRPLDYYLDAPARRRLHGRGRHRADDRGRASRSGTSSSPPMPTRCSAGSAARRRSTARRRRRRRRPTAWRCSASR